MDRPQYRRNSRVPTNYGFACGLTYTTSKYKIWMEHHVLQLSINKPDGTSKRYDSVDNNFDLTRIFANAEWKRLNK